MDLWRGQWSEHPKGDQKNFTKTCIPLYPYADYPAVRETVTAFLDAVIAQDVKLGNALDVAQLSAIGMAIDESKDTGTWVEVNQIK